MALFERKCPDCDDVLPQDARACQCGWRSEPKKRGAVEIDRGCPWDDHGQRCGRPGSMSEATNGSGPWWCSDHYWYGLRKMVRPEHRKFMSHVAAMLPPMREPGDDDEVVREDPIEEAAA